MITGKATITGLLGWPVSHSLSPHIHNEWLARHGIDGAYIPIPVQPEKLEQVIKALGAMHLRGCNLTVPHKEAAMRYVDAIDPVARRIGAINTIVWDDKGASRGLNTDAYGFIASLKQQIGDLSAYLARPVIIGAGGAARAVVMALHEAGAGSIQMMNRTEEKISQLAQEMELKISILPWNEKAEALSEATMVVNTTSLGMHHQPSLELSLEALPRASLVCDIVYAPLMTPLLVEASKRGNPVATGIGMLAHQAAKAFEIWHGMLPDITEEWLHSLSQSANHSL